MPVIMKTKTAKYHMMPPQLRLCNGLARPADESMLAPDISNGTSDWIVSSAHKLRKVK